ncbi:MAG: cytochrome c3 family protein [candidate division NC10 bacterium]|nr:cytochrome c3 family protein [candidate division NC10 bacterium]
MRQGWRTGAAWLAGAILALGGQAAAQQLRLPPDLAYAKAEGSPGNVIFSHQFHVPVSEKCTACHVTLFRMLTPTRTVTHVEMEAGRSCGACHNDRMAFGPTDAAGCGRCHVGEGRSGREPGTGANARVAASHETPAPH